MTNCCKKNVARMTSLILVFFVLSGMGCDFRVERDYKQLVFHVISEPPTLNPLTHTDAVASSIEAYMFDSLLDRDRETLEFKPMIAKKWEISDDHLQYTFYLRDDVYWHDGVKLTADDIIFSFEKIQDPKVDAAPLRVYFRDVSKVKKLDDYTVRFTYAYPYFRALSILGNISILPKHILEKTNDFNKDPFGRAPIGNGPYKFKEWKTGSRIVLVRNENYWNEKPAIEGIVFRIITDSGVALQVLKKGEIDLADITIIPWVKQTGSKNFKERFDKYKYFLPNYSFVAWNQGRPFFKDARVRRAMTMMVNREKMKEKLYFDLVEIVTGDAYKFGPDYNSDVEPLPYDPIEAVRLLDEAGWIDHDGDGIRDKDGVPFEFTFMTAGSATSERITNIMREDLGKIGIKMEVAKFEWAVFSKNLTDHAFDATMLGWSMPFEYDPFQLWHSSQVDRGSNFISFKNAEADRLIEDIRREFNPEERKKMSWRLHEIFHEEQPYTFLFITPSLVALQKRFTNVKVYKTGIEMKEWGIDRPTMTLYQ